MNDALDDALRRMPSDPYPEELTDRILSRLALAQRRQRQLRRAGWVSTATAAVSGVWLCAKWLAVHRQMLPDFSAGPVMRWLQHFAGAPQQAFLGGTFSLWDWTRWFSAQIDGLVVAALAALAAAGLWVLVTLLHETDRDEVSWV